MTRNIIGFGLVSIGMVSAILAIVSAIHMPSNPPMLDVLVGVKLAGLAIVGSLAGLLITQ
tara:strand:- start:78 stop:257 length:180 start_codon:yes stop_codon:yes gene_type:complete